jgi:peptide/nickel transport system permease protein
VDTFKLIFQRLVLAFVVVTGATFLLALLIQLLPGDPAVMAVPNAMPDRIEGMRRDMGLDRGVFGFFWKWYSEMFQGDFGNQYSNNDTISVSVLLKRALPTTLLIIFYVQIVSIIISVPLGLISAYREGSRFDRYLQTVLFALSSIPSFALALILVLICAVRFDWFPVLGYVGPTENLLEHFKSMALPVASLSFGITASYTRLLRTDVIATLKDDYIMMANSKGISKSRVLWRHVLRASSTTLLTSAALNMGGLVGGTIITEILFNLPGMGYQIAFAIASRQVISLMSFIAVVAAFYVFFNTMVDVIANIVDPRTRERRV